LPFPSFPVILSNNRAYYAIFYAANTLLATQEFPRSKHPDVIAAFRQYFVAQRITLFGTSL